MNKVILIRFGSAPSPAVSQALKQHIVGTKAVALPIPGAIMSVFNTESAIEDISESVKETGAFFVISKWNDINLCLPMEVLAAIEDVLGPEEDVRESELTFDDVLDLINQNGINSLTPAQLKILEDHRLDI